ncbi:MAG: DNA-binding protein WhiA [Nakamurella sp.]
MAMTSSVKDELCRLTTQLDPTAPDPDKPRPLKVSERKAEVASLLRFAGGLHIVGGRAIVEADLDTGAVARRLRAEISDLYNQNADVQVLAPTGSRKSTRYVVRVIHGGDTLARQTGLIDQRGRPVRGLPPQVVAGSVTDAIGAWRGAFLAQGSLTDPGRSASLEVICPGPEAALALVGAARRMGVAAKAREVRGADRVVVRDGDAIALMLRLLGAARTLAGWEERRQRRESVQTSTNRLANFDDANLRRSARAAVAASARVSRALEILGPTAPGHLIQAGDLRIAHGHASLEELGQLADPPMTKDAIAGRIRRLLTMADKRAQELDIPDTESVVTPEMLEG